MRFMPLDRKKRCEAAESLCSGLPIPTQVVASDEFMPVPQTERQRTVERGLLEIADTVSPRHGLDRRKFLRTSGGMAARSEEHTSELQSLMRISYAVFCL